MSSPLCRPCPSAAFPAGSLVFLTTDGKLYSTATGAAGSWGNVVSAAALSGTIGAGQIAAGAVGASALADGVVTGSKFASGIKTLQTMDALPDLPDPEYPPGTVIFIPSEGRLYRVQEAVDLIPIMTSNTAPSGVASASSEYGAAQAAWRAFNDQPAGWESTLADGSPWTLEYQFALARVITWYSVTGCAAGLTESPKTWTFEAWNGSAWVVLDTQTNVTGWVAGTKKAFDITNETSYSRYRLNISATSGSAYCGVDEFEMSGWMQSAPTYLKDADIATDAAIAKSKLAALSITNADVASGAAIAASKLDLTALLARVAALEGAAGSSVPHGLIAMWDEFTQGAIPTGWSLCDGLGGRPNLKDKFIVGAKGAYAAGATGGALSHGHAAGTSGSTASTASNVPSVNATSAAGAHGHTAPASGSCDRVLAHTHGSVALYTGGGDGARHFEVTGTGNNGQNLGHTHDILGSTDSGNAPDHLHYSGGATTGNPADHSHTLSNHTHTGAAHTHSTPASDYQGNLPPYYALCFIMKD